MVDDPVNLLGVVFEEQFGFQIGVRHAGQELNFVPAQGVLVLKQARDQRRQGKQMLDIVAVIGHQDRVAAFQRDDVTQFLGLARDQAHVFAVVDPILATAFRQRDGVGVGKGFQQVGILVHQANQLAFIHSQAIGAQQNRCSHANGIDGDRCVNAGRNTIGQFRHRLIEPFWPVFGIVGFFPPAWFDFVQYLSKGNGFTEVYSDLAKRVAQLANGLGNREHALFLFFLAP